MSGFAQPRRRPNEGKAVDGIVHAPASPASPPCDEPLKNFPKILQRVLDKPDEGHYTPLQTAATRFWTGD
ncbi:hypothetical protein QN224_24845 [Sinorhizobium sp. 8-89]|uniref:hypothetical protein n=1 Tax=Sinorhizobium sp. 7-81 TaxID=3049087 RepID=UPI0024C2783B|nr:hypothetical protein [Sinorhizobium sp. 7-81]MDK1388640.1 hypothetical protein [Sinorhizobium sp. 7-81]